MVVQFYSHAIRCLNEYDVNLEAVAFSINTCGAGPEAAVPLSDQVATYTVRTLQRTLPPALGAVLLLAGNVPAQEAVRNAKAVQDEASSMTWQVAPVYGLSLLNPVIAAFACGEEGEARELLRRLLGACKSAQMADSDHYVMLNDYGRNHFYRNALAAALPRCSGCRVLDLGAGSGLLAMLAAQLGAQDVLALEANPKLAELANKTIEDNRGLFPNANIKVLAQLSSQVQTGRPVTDDAPEAFDLLVTETFGSLLLGESALAFVADARQRLLKHGGRIIPAGGCQYVTLVQFEDTSPWHPQQWRGFNFSSFRRLQDTLYWKATFGASGMKVAKISHRICVLEVDLHQMSPNDIPQNRTLQIQAQRNGTVHAALFDWDIWSEKKKTEVLSTAPGFRNFAGDVAWGWLLQLQETATHDWKFQKLPEPLHWLEMAVEFIMHGVSISVRLRPVFEGIRDVQDGILPAFSPPSRIRQPGRFAMKEANEFLLPVAGDVERHNFYAAALDDAVKILARNGLTLLDCSSNAGMPSFYAARHGIRSVVMPRSDHLGEVLRQMKEDQGLNDTAEVLVGDPREMLAAQACSDHFFTPFGTPLHGMSPFAILPSIRKELIQEHGIVVPSLACLEVALVESEQLSHMFSIPNGRWDEVDLREWNREAGESSSGLPSGRFITLDLCEARRQGVLNRLVPYTKWLGSRSSIQLRWLSSPECVYNIDLNAYARTPAAQEETSDLELPVSEDGLVHAIVARWAVFTGEQRLGAESSYVQAVAKPGTDPGLLEPLPVEIGLEKMQMVIRQGAAKVTGAAGPEFTLRLLRADGEIQPFEDRKRLTMAAAAGLDVHLHPLVLINISDHVVRFRSAQRSERVLGALLGAQEGRRVDVHNSFELVCVESGGQRTEPQKHPFPAFSLRIAPSKGHWIWNSSSSGFPSIWRFFQDMNFLVGILQVLNQKRQIKPSTRRSRRSANENPFALLVDADKMSREKASQSEELPVKVYDATIHIEQGEATVTWNEVPYIIDTLEAERIAVNHVAKSATTATASYSSDFTQHTSGLSNSVVMLSNRIKELLEHMKDVKEGRAPKNQEVLRQTLSICQALQSVHPSSLKQEFCGEFNDATLVVLLATLTKVCSNTSDLLDKFQLAYDRTCVKIRRSLFCEAGR
eukprot:symbB.v1.2.004796.t1/scaffold270.1/size246978/7